MNDPSPEEPASDTTTAATEQDKGGIENGWMDGCKWKIDKITKMQSCERECTYNS